MKLDRIKVKGFKSIKEMDLELGSLNVLIGANGAGKSNFIGVFRLINQIIEENLQFYVRQAGGANVLLHYGRKKTTSLEIFSDLIVIKPNSFLPPMILFSLVMNVVFSRLLIQNMTNLFRKYSDVVIKNHCWRNVFS